MPDGMLPVFSTNTEDEARKLIALCCPIDYDGNYFARELREEQTLENLQKFSDRLQRGWDHMKRNDNEKLVGHGSGRPRQNPRKAR